MISTDSSTITKSTKQPRVSIGLPVYNEERFIRKKLDSLVAQTFADFELIISDNASTDSTPIICEEYSKKDKRIRYVRQQKNMGPIWNFNFVLHEAKHEYFAWTAADDIMSPDFIKKNIGILESDKNIVGSISKVGIDRGFVDPFIKEKRILQKIGFVYRPLDTPPIIGTYEKRIRTYLKKFPWQMFYAVYRTDKLRQSFFTEPFIGHDAAVVLNALKYGDIQVVDEILFHSFPTGMSSRGIFRAARGRFKHGFLGLIFPMFPLTIWCVKHLGTRVFLKNLDHFIRLNFDGGLIYLVDIIRWFKKKKF